MPDTRQHQPSTVSVQRANDGVTRHETLEGRDHLVVPVVMIREGVLNGALLTREEFGAFPAAWDGRPVPVLHPEDSGEPISANSPRVLERTIGKLFQTHVEGDKLKAEAWIDVQKAQALGFGPMLETLEAGTPGMEVSTGYFSDSEPAEGEFNGRPYTEIHRNIRPDHLALLPGEIGACSWADGCGVRANKRGMRVKVNEALNVLRQALGLRTHCAGGCTGECHCNGGTPMPDDKQTLVQRAKKLHANKKLTPEQMEMLQNLGEDEQQLAMAKAFLDAVEAGGGESDPDDGGGEPSPMMDPDDPEHMKANKGKDKSEVVTMSREDLNKTIAAQVDERMRRQAVTEKLVANEACPFSEDELADMPVAHLEKLEKSIRPADFGGQGGFASNADADDPDAQPLTIHRGVLTREDKQEA